MARRRCRMCGTPTRNRPAVCDALDCVQDALAMGILNVDPSQLELSQLTSTIETTTSGRQNAPDQND